tara:strand:- start:779 stop:997 length:219 start_codon:yes stop_codon:yes gene_type:complete
MFRAVVDTKQGKVWANHPFDQAMVEVADVNENAENYLVWTETLGQIRQAQPERVEKFYNLLVKKIECLQEKD